MAINRELSSTEAKSHLPIPPRASDIPTGAQSRPDVVLALNTDPINGLSEEEVRKRLQQYGPNSFPEEEEETVWSSLLNAFRDPLALVLTFAAILSAAIGVINGETQQLQQAAWIMAIVVFMTLIGYFTDPSANQELGKLKDLQKTVARIVRES